MSTTPASSVRAASLALTGSLVDVVGTVDTDNANATTGAVALGSMTRVRLQGTYTSAAASSTGRPIIAIDVSMDAPTTSPGSVGRWVPVQLLDNSTFSAGRIDGFVYKFSPAPTIATGAGAVAGSFGTPPYDVGGASWMRVRAADVDGVNPGAISALKFGGEAGS